MYAPIANSQAQPRPGMGDASTALTQISGSTGLSTTTLLLILVGGGLVLGYMLQPKVAAARRRAHSAATHNLEAWKVVLITAAIAGGAWYAGKKGWL
jgi:hypothetical protein